MRQGNADDKGCDWSALHHFQHFDFFTLLHNRPFRPFRNLTPPSVLAVNCTVPFNPDTELQNVHDGVEATMYLWSPVDAVLKTWL